MPVNPVSVADTQYVATYQPVNVKEYPDRYIYTYEEQGTTGKKIGVGVASYCIPGLGQAINGQWGKAAGFFAGIMGGRAIYRSVVLNPVIKEALELYTKTANGKEKLDILTKSFKKNLIGIFAGSILLTGATVWTIVDAVKNAKSKHDVVVMKEPAPVQTTPQPAIAEAQT